jgi:hypothetical protein
MIEPGDDPVAQDRLVDAGLVVERREDVVAALDHLARRLDVERFVRVPDRRAIEIDEIRADCQYEQEGQYGSNLNV